MQGYRSTRLRLGLLLTCGTSVDIGIMEKKMETTRVYWGYIGDYIGIMEKKMETTP